MILPVTALKMNPINIKKRVQSQNKTFLSFSQAHSDRYNLLVNKFSFISELTHSIKIPLSASCTKWKLIDNYFKAI